jgi:hypothetical protein
MRISARPSISLHTLAMMVYANCSLSKALT